MRQISFLIGLNTDLQGVSVCLKSNATVFVSAVILLSQIFNFAEKGQLNHLFTITLVVNIETQDQRLV